MRGVPIDPAGTARTTCWLSTIAFSVSLGPFFTDHAVQENRGKSIGGFLFGQFNEIRIAEVLADCVIVNRTKKCLDGDIGVPVVETTLSLSQYYIFPQKPKQRANLTADVFFRELVAFE